MISTGGVETHLSAAALAQLAQHYHIRAQAVMLEFDHDFDQFAQWLAQHRQTNYAAQEKILIVHFDTDYYLPGGYGVNLNNLFEVWTDLGVPVSAMILYTNHLGITAEVEKICQNLGVQDRPVVLETLLTKYNHARPHATDSAVDQINTHALCLMAGSPRSHRYALYNHLRDLVPQHIILTINSAHAST
jgi:hypothetical protein